jgi:hypothetical protein
VNGTAEGQVDADSLWRSLFYVLKIVLEGTREIAEYLAVADAEVICK